MTDKDSSMAGPLPYAFGITVMPEWFQHEGVDAVLDRVQAAGATAIATSPYLLERMPEGEGGREPPPDGEAGKVRPLERPLFGAKELWVRASPAFEHDFGLYRGLRYQPAPPTSLTRTNLDLMDRVLSAAQKRGIVVFFQVMAAMPPAYKVQFSSAWEDDQCLGPGGARHDGRVDKNASLASGHVIGYLEVLLKELAARYPGVAGFRLDWPEYPPYDVQSAMFDFNRATYPAMLAAGEEPERVRQAAEAWIANARAIASSTADSGAPAVTDALAPLWDELICPTTPLRALHASKQSTCLAFLARCRAALDELPGQRRRLEPQVFPPPFHALSGFPLDRLRGLSDAVGVKLYTMHWPMIARFWARDLIGEIDGPRADAVGAAVGKLFGFVDTIPSIPSGYHYPGPGKPHPVGVAAQRAKLDAARKIAGTVPVVAFAHAYGPTDDFLQRFMLAREGGDAVWLNRYGYLSDEKFGALSQLALTRTL